MSALVGLWADIDVKTSFAESKEEAIEKLREIQLPPTVIVDSGGGIHGWWLFTTPYSLVNDNGDVVQEKFDLMHELMSKWMEMLRLEFKHDVDNLVDAARVGRLPGTFNWKQDDNPRPVVIVDEHSDRRYKWEHLMEYVHDVELPDRVKSSSSGRKNSQVKMRVPEDLKDKADGARHYMACPAHGGDNPQGASATYMKDGSWRLFCYTHQCEWKDIATALGIIRSNGSIELVTQEWDEVLEACRAIGRDIRYNERSWDVEMWDGDGWRLKDDHIYAALRGELRKACYTVGVNKKTQETYKIPWSPAREIFNEILDHIAYHTSVDPFIEWLEALPEWDGVERINHVYSTAFHGVPENDELINWASRYLFMGAVQKAYEPDVVIRTIPVIMGPQEAGKSTLLRYIFPREHRDNWFGGDIQLTGDNKKRVESIQGKVLGEITEMIGTGSNRDMESMKSFISLPNDGGVRLAWRHNTQRLLRRVIFVGTTNRSTPLPNDPTGNTRFVGITVGHGRDRIEPLCDEFREQWWSEAMHKYGMGVRAELPYELRKIRDARNMKYRQDEPLIEDRLPELRRQVLTGEKRVSLAKITEMLQMVEMQNDSTRISRVEQNRLTSALHQHGWKRVWGGNHRLWEPPCYCKVKIQGIYDHEEECIGHNG